MMMSKRQILNSNRRMFNWLTSKHLKALFSFSKSIQFSVLKFEATSRPALNSRPAQEP